MNYPAFALLGLMVLPAAASAEMYVAQRKGDKKAEKFLYDDATGKAHRKSGESEEIAVAEVERAKKQQFRFVFPTATLKVSKEDECVEAAKAKNVDYIALTKKAKAGSSSALKEWFVLGETFDGAAAENHSQRFWPLVNSWKDNDLEGFLKSQDPALLADFSGKFRSSAPFENVEDYLRLIYPRSSKLILARH